MIRSAIELRRGDDDRLLRLCLGHIKGHLLNLGLMRSEKSQDDLRAVVPFIQSFADQQRGPRDKALSQSALVADLEVNKLAADNRHDPVPVLLRIRSADMVRRFIGRLLQHNKANLAVLNVPCRNGIASQPLNRRPIGEQVFVRLNLGREVGFQNAILSLVPIRNLKRNALRSFGNLLSGRHGCTHRHLLSEPLIEPRFLEQSVFSALMRRYYDACGVAA